MDDEELGLPTPQKYEGEKFSALDYHFSPEYAGLSLEDAIALRGIKAFFKQVNSEDFADVTAPHLKKVGIIELFADSTWASDEKNSRNVTRERLLASLKKNDVIKVNEIVEKGRLKDYKFYCAGTLLPYEPYHDYDLQLLESVFNSVDADAGERVLGVVREVSCFGEDNGVPDDPTFCWRVYTGSLTLYLVAPEA